MYKPILVNRRRTDWGIERKKEYITYISNVAARTGARTGGEKRRQAFENTRSSSDTYSNSVHYNISYRLKYINTNKYTHK